MQLNVQRLLLLFFLGCLSCCSWAQDIRGEVILEDSAPLMSVQVIVRVNEKIVGFSSTDINGKFRLSVNTESDTVDLEARYLGFKPWKTTILLSVDLEPLKIVLREAVVGLKEVEVSASLLPRVEKNDTIVHRTENYRDGNERKVEELIAKLPGIEVGKNGAIKYNDIPLDRILVDGEDLFDKNYTLLSQNVPADLVDQIDIITDHQSDKLIGDLNSTGELALNLHLDPDKKRPIFGELGVQTGAPRSNAANLNVFRLGKKLKTVFFTDYNNYGQSSDAGFRALRQSNGVSDRSLTESVDVLRSPAENLPGLLLKRDFLNSQDYGAAQTILFGLGEKTKNRIIYNVFGHFHEFDSQTLREDVLPFGIDSFLEISDRNYRYGKFWVQNDFEHYFDDKSRLDVRVGVAGQTKSGRWNSKLTDSNSPVTDSLAILTSDGGYNYALTSRYVRRITPKTAVRVVANYQNEQQDQLQAYFGGVYDNVLTGDGEKLQQLYNQDRNFFASSVSLLYGIGKVKTDFKVGVERQRIRTETSLAYGDSVESNLSVSPYVFDELYVSPSLGGTAGKVKWNGTVRASRFWLDNSFSGQPSARFALLPAFNVQGEVGKRGSVRIYGKLALVPTLPEQLINETFLISHSVLRQSLDSAYLISAKSAGAAYRYSNNYTQFGYGVTASYNETPGGIRSTFTSDGFIQIENLIAGAKSNSIRLSANTHKYIEKWKAYFKLSYGWSRFQSVLEINETVFTSTSTWQTFSLRANTIIAKWLRFSNKTEVSAFSNFVLDGKLVQHQLETRQEVNVAAGENSRFELTYRTIFSQLDGEHPINLLDAEVIWDIKRPDISLRFGGRNLLGNNKVETLSIGTFQRFQREYRLRPRTVYVEVVKAF